MPYIEFFCETILANRNKIWKYRRPSLFAVFLSAVSLIHGPKTAFFKETILQFQLYIGIFIREFVIRGPIFQERIYRE